MSDNTDAVMPIAKPFVLQRRTPEEIQATLLFKVSVLETLVEKLEMRVALLEAKTQRVFR